MSVHRGEGELGRCLRHGEAIEAVLEHGVDMAVGAGTDGDRAGASRFQSVLAIAFAEPEQAEARAVALLGMGTISEDRLDVNGRPSRATQGRPS